MVSATRPLAISEEVPSALVDRAFPTIEPSFPGDPPSRLQRKSAEAVANLNGSSLSLAEPDIVYIDWQVGDLDNPYNWSKTKKWIALACSFLCSASTVIIGTGYDAAESQVTAEFNIGSILFLTGNTTFLCFNGIAPLFLAPFSELVGRKSIFLIAAFLNAAMAIPQALAGNIEGILLSRVIQGAACSIGTSVSGGIVADVFHSQDRGFPMSVFTLIIFTGQAIGPTLTAYTCSRQDWRVIFWWEGAIALLSFVVMLAFLQETRGPVLLSRKAEKMTREGDGQVVYRCRADDERISVGQMIRISASRPILYLLTEPIVTAFATWMAFLWACVFLSFQAIPIAFSDAYGWTPQQGSYVLAILAVGAACGWSMSFYQDFLYDKTWRKHDGKPPPEARLYMPCVGGALVPIGLFW